MVLIDLALILKYLYTEFAQKLYALIGRDTLVGGIAIEVDDPLDLHAKDDAGAGDAGRKGDIEGTICDVTTVFGGVQNGIFLSMDGQRTGAFAIAAATFVTKLGVTVVGTCWWPVVADRDDAGILGEHCPHMAFDTMAAFGQVVGQLHVDVIKLGDGLGQGVHSWVGQIRD